MIKLQKEQKEVLNESILMQLTLGDALVISKCLDLAMESIQEKTEDADDMNDLSECIIMNLAKTVGAINSNNIIMSTQNALRNIHDINDAIDSQLNDMDFIIENSNPTEDIYIKYSGLFDENSYKSITKDEMKEMIDKFL